jgi:SPP1 gp7 family putative phage head morphogenesis protein
MIDAEATPFDLPFDEAIAHFRAKGLEISPNSWRDVWQEANARSFTVARVTAMDVLGDVKAEAQKAFNSGISLGEFKKNLIPMLQQKGWLAPKGEMPQVTMPDGTVRKRLTPWRLETIYRTNLQTAYSVGRYQQMMEAAESRPYWQYRAIMDRRTRPRHAAMNGRVYDSRHPIWNSWYPPNGFNCFPAGTPVLTTSGWRPIEQIGLNDRVIGGSGDEQRVSAIHRNWFDGDMVRLQVKDAFIDATPNHRVLTMRGWVRADRLKPGDILVQTTKTAPMDMLIGDVNDADAEGGNLRMPLPAQGEAAEMFAFNGQVQGRDIEIEPLGAGWRGHDMVKQYLQPEIQQVGIHHSLGPGRGPFGAGVGERITAYPQALAGGVLDADLRAICGRRHPEFFGSSPGAGIGLFGFSDPWMLAQTGHAADDGTHVGSSIEMPFFRGMHPLGSDGITAASRGDAKVSEQAHDRSAIDLPAPAKSPVRQLFREVASGEDFRQGAPLNCFNTLDEFRGWATLHCGLHSIVAVERKRYIGIVYNFSVGKDNSYQVHYATVHNCRCYVKSLGTRDVEERDLTVSTRGVDAKPDEGWDYNVGREFLRLGDDWLAGPYKEKPGQRTFADFGRPDIRNVALSARMASPVQIRTAKDVGFEESFAEALQSVGLTDADQYRAIHTGDNEQALLSGQQLKHLYDSGDGRERYIPYIVPTLEQPYEVYLTEYENPAGRTILRKRYVGLFEGAKKENYLAVLDLGRDGSVLWNAFVREKNKINGARIGTLIYAGNAPRL